MQEISKLSPAQPKPAPQVRPLTLEELQQVAGGPETEVGDHMGVG